ncbi:MAG: hypothetical protein HKN49_12760, partial [Gammaproteobacteria bacterium]|nr:hypothetical protein [Gammaproteobacteria bacterium]
MTKSLAIAATILVCSGAANAQLVPAATDFINHVRWTVRHGLNQQTVTDVIEARSGYLWVSTYGGLARFDGVRFRTFELDNTSQLGTNKLVSLFEDSRDRLWIGTNGYGAVRYYEGEFRRFANGAPRDDIQDFVQDRSGTVWAAGRGISKFIETESEAYFEPVNQPAWIADTHVPDLVIRNDGQLWAASERGILRSTNGAFEVVLQSEFARHTRAMVVDAENRLWLASRHGIGYLEDGQIHVVRTHDEYVFSANLDASGRVLVGTSSGLYRLSADVDDVQLEKISLPQKDDSLQSGVTALHLDRTGDIWVGTNTFGLIRISEVPFSQFEDPRGLPQGSVSTVVTDPRNGVWLQGDSGWIAWRDNSRIISMTGHAGWPGHENMRLLGVSSSGDLWLRTADSLLQVRGSIETGFSSDQYPYQVAQAFLEDADGHLWFGTNGALLEFHDGVFHRRKVGELAEPLLPRLLDAEGAVWFTAPGVLGYVVASDDAFQYQLLGHGVDWLDSEARSLHQDSS